MFSALAPWASGLASPANFGAKRRRVSSQIFKEAGWQKPECVVHANRVGGVVIPFPHVARTPERRHHHQAAVHRALRKLTETYQNTLLPGDAVTLACAIAVAFAQAALFLMAFGIRVF